MFQRFHLDGDRTFFQQTKKVGGSYNETERRFQPIFLSSIKLSFNLKNGMYIPPLIPSLIRRPVSYFENLFYFRNIVMEG